MRHAIRNVIMLALLATPAGAIAADKPANPESSSLVRKPVDKAFRAAYDADVAKARAGEPVDLVDLRSRHARIFGGYGVAGEWRQAVLKEFEAQDWKKGYELASKNLDSDYLDLDAHFLARYAASKLNDGENLQKHTTFMKQSLDAITRGRTGHSAEQAWTVMSAREEYLMLQVLGLEMRNQSLMHKDGHSYDVMAAWNPSIGTADEIWFNIDAFFGKGF